MNSASALSAASFQTLTVRQEGAVLLVEISAPPMKFWGGFAKFFLMCSAPLLARNICPKYGSKDLINTMLDQSLNRT